ncbi:MAG: Aminodeoxychorismate lyase [candidate division CPR1 bacterium GW2011_GWC1_49_13]|uniref:Endolytic murein transglycosylase n=1 Tax=candidate division CPR1 bacterium GW2011_GWC1_49_13 TaxID=1618342 RepID=A0A0G1VHB8_9BACT|nr:MAG: Aminodeoxychorismate lyase [candidate division CPR1 bacterium GW2011_GWC1_49_13]
MNFFKLVLPLLFLAALSAGGAWAYFNWEVNRPSGLEEKTEFVIKPGESVKSISRNLEGQRIVRSATIFTLYVRLQGLSTNLQAGRYEILPTFSLAQIADFFQHGTFDVRLTFYEGWRKEQYLEYALETLAVEDQEFSAQFNAATAGLEGYLFPDTYIVPVNIEANALVKILRDNFSVKYDQVKAAAQKTGLTQKQIVTVASLVERETADDTDSLEEMRTIAGIIIKRWRSGWYLGVDAAIQYALGYDAKTDRWWKLGLTRADLQIDSPYNTYTHLGLPPGPICNPGLDSLTAVSNAKTTTLYWYYLHGKDGEVRYAETLEQHNQNIAKYLR